MGPQDDALEVYCLHCGSENRLPFGDALHNRTLACTSCGRPIHWRSCPACETGWVAQRPEEPCPECGADPAGHIPEMSVPPTPGGRRSPWHRACPVCGTAFVPFLASVGGRYMCPHCKRILEDASPTLLVLWRAVAALLVMTALLPVLDGGARSLLGAGYGAVRPVALAVLGVLLLAAALAWLTRAIRLRPWRP